MAIRVGFLGVAHMHAWGYVAALRTNCRARVASVWDDDPSLRDRFALEHGMHQASSVAELFESVDAVVITSENKSHVRDISAAWEAGKHILCEKPVVTSAAEADQVRKNLDSSTILMTAFPCRFAPAYARLKERVANGEIGAIRSVCATNRGRCPFDWFVDSDKSGGGAMIDHTVHVADLLRDLLGEGPRKVTAQTGNGLHGLDVEDSALLTLEYPSGVFATIDASWSRPASYKTWGDVTMNVVGDLGVIELDLFAQEVQVWNEGHKVGGYGSNLDSMLVSEFLSAIEEGRQPATSLDDGLAASAVAIEAYASV